MSARYVVTLTLAGFESRRCPARSWREACALAAMYCEDMIRELRPMYANGTERVRRGFGNARDALAFFTGEHNEYRLPRPPLPGSAVTVDAAGYRLTVRRG